jgi:hypothetical protein
MPLGRRNVRELNARSGLVHGSLNNCNIVCMFLYLNYSGLSDVRAREGS